MADWDDTYEQRPAKKRKKSRKQSRNSVYWLAATVSLLTPFSTCVVGGIVQPAMGDNRTGIIIVGVIVLVMLLVGFVLGVIALFAPPEDRHPMLYLQAVPGMGINAFLLVASIGGLFMIMNMAKQKQLQAQNPPANGQPPTVDRNVIQRPTIVIQSEPPQPPPRPPLSRQTAKTEPVVPIAPQPTTVEPTKLAPPVMQPKTAVPSGLRNRPPIGGPTTRQPQSPQQTITTPGAAVTQPLVGGTSGREFRQERRGKPVLGFIHRTGKVMNTPVVLGVTALFSEQDATFGQDRTFAKSGYAVGGLNVEADQFLTAMQVVFYRLNNDGTLDASDQYTSDWIGTPTGKSPTRLDGQGKLVLGLHGRRAQAMNAIGLLTAP